MVSVWDQATWSRSNSRAGDRGGARAGKPCPEPVAKPPAARRPRDLRGHADSGVEQAIGPTPSDKRAVSTSLGLRFPLVRLTKHGKPPTVTYSGTISTKKRSANCDRRPMGRIHAQTHQRLRDRGELRPSRLAAAPQRLRLSVYREGGDRTQTDPCVRDHQGHQAQAAAHPFARGGGAGDSDSGRGFKRGLAWRPTEARRRAASFKP